MRTSDVLVLGLSALALQGCIARTAVDIVTLPVKAVSAGVDAVTTSQSEADEKRGRALRERDERLGALSRELEKQSERCAGGDDEACEEAEALRAEIDALKASAPAEPQSD